MTLSNDAVQRELARHFTCAWIDTTGDEAAGSSFAHSPKDAPGSCVRGNGEHNVQILMLTPDGRLLHAISGYVDAEPLLEALAFARTLARVVAREHEAEVARDLISMAHEERLEFLEQQAFEGPLAAFEKMRVTGDHRYVQKHPLQDAKAFRIEALVGKATTFFGSSQGERPKEFVGDPAKDVRRRLEGKQR